MDGTDPASPSARRRRLRGVGAGLIAAVLLGGSVPGTPTELPPA